MAESAGLEPTILESKSSVLPITPTLNIPPFSLTTYLKNTNNKKEYAVRAFTDYSH